MPTILAIWFLVLSCCVMLILVVRELLGGTIFISGEEVVATAKAALPRSDS